MDVASVQAALAARRIRTLARELAGDGAADHEVESWRRQLYRVRDGGGIEDPDRRERVAAALGVPADLLAPRVSQRPPTANRDIVDRLDRLERMVEELPLRNAAAIRQTLARDEEKDRQIAEQLDEQTKILDQIVDVVAELKRTSTALARRAAR